MPPAASAGAQQFASKYVDELVSRWEARDPPAATLDELARLHRGIEIAVRNRRVSARRPLRPFQVSTDEGAGVCAEASILRALAVADAHVKRGASIEAWGDSDDDAQDLACAFEACALSLRIATATDAGLRHLASAERLQACVDFVKHAATKVISPLLENKDAERKDRKKLFESGQARCVQRLDEALLLSRNALARGPRLEDALLGRLRAAAAAVLAVDAAAAAAGPTAALASLQHAALGLTAALFNRRGVTADDARDHHRAEILDDLFALMIAPRHKKQLRTFRVEQHAAGGKAAADGALQHVRLSSALAVLLVQETREADDDDDQGDDDEDEDKAAYDVGGRASDLLGAAERTAAAVCGGLVLRCGKSGPLLADWRAQLVLLVDDAAALLALPGWPAAQTVTKALGDMLTRELREKREQVGQDANSFVLFAIDAVAHMCSPLLKLRKSTRDEDEQRDEASGADVAGLLQLVLNTVSDRAVAEPWMEPARKYHVAVALSNMQGAQNEELRRHFEGQWWSASVGDESGANWRLKGADWDAILGPAECAAVCRRVVAATPLLAVYPEALVAHLAAPLGHESATVRARCVKAVDAVLAADASLVAARPAVQAALVSRLHDEAISVRQAAVDCIGNQMALPSGGVSPDAYARYHPALLERLGDTGVSVRKSVVRILQKSLQTASLEFYHSATLARLVQRASHPNEEATIKDLVRDTIRENWLASGSVAAHVEEEEDDEVPKKRKARGLCASTRQLVAVASSDRGALWVAKVLRHALRDSTADDEAASSAKRAKHSALQSTAAVQAALHAAALVEHLIELDEVRSAESGARTLGGALAGDVVAACRGLRALAEASPACVAPQLSALAPYLRGDNGLASAVDEAAVCCAVADVVRHAQMALQPKDAHAAAKDAVPGLLLVVNRFGSKVIEAALKCLAAFADRGADVARAALRKLYETHHGTLRRVNAAGSSLTAAQASAGARCAVVLGLLCRHDAAGLACLGGLGDAQCLGGSDADGNSHAGAAALYAALKSRFEHCGDSTTEKHCAVALCSLFGSAARILPRAQRDGTVERMLAHADGGVRAAALLAWTDALDAAAEKGLESAADDSKDEVLRREGVEAAAHVEDDATSALSAATQAHVPRFVASCFEGSALARRATVVVLGAVLRHGLANPREILPVLVAAHGDASIAVRGEAARLVTLELARHGDYVRSSFVAGVALLAARRVAEKRRGAEEACAVEDVSAAIGDVYAAAVRPHKAARHAALRALVEVCHKRPKLKHVISAASPAALVGAKLDEIDDAMWLETAQLVLKLVAALPFSAQDEPLFVVSLVSRLANLDATTIFDRLKLRFEGDEDVVPDAVPGDAAKARSDVVSAHALSSALTLKKHLKSWYRLTDARCRAYSPSEAAKESKGPDRALTVDAPAFGALRLADPPNDLCGESDAAHEDRFAAFQHFESLLAADDAADFDVTAGKSPRKATPRKSPKTPSKTPTKTTTSKVSAKKTSRSTSRVKPRVIYTGDPTLLPSEDESTALDDEEFVPAKKPKSAKKRKL